LAPTRNQVAVTGISTFRISQGKMVEGWVDWRRPREALTAQLQGRAASAKA